jgi:glycosyltransferase involved in cell wall biosynthesis
VGKSLQVVGNSSYGGASYHIVKWCGYLVDRGWQVDVLATDPVFVAELGQLSGVRVLEEILIPREIAPLADSQALIKLLVFLRQERYDVVHTYTATPGFLGRIAARLAGVPVILHHQAGWTVTSYSTPMQRMLYTPLEYLATLASTRGVCVSHAVAEQAHQLRLAPKSKLVTICDGIDPEPFVAATENGDGQSVRRDLNIRGDHLLIGNVGRLAEQKNNETLVRAMNPLKTLLNGRSFTLLLVGDGPDRSLLEDLIESLDLTENVRLLGFRRDIPALLDAVDVFVSPSLWEGLSISVLEAMAAAKPIITTSVPSNAELIEHGVTGLLVPPRSPETLAGSIYRFVQEPALAQQCARNARQRVLERYTLDRMLSETWTLYMNLLMGE